MPNAIAPIEKTTTYNVVTKTCRATADRGVFRKQYIWEKINDLDVLWPHNHVRTAAISAAKKFVEDMRKQGFDLVTAESDIVIYGPLRHHDFSRSASAQWAPAKDMKRTFQTFSYAFDDEDDDDAEDFLLRAQFLSKKVKRVEHTLPEKVEIATR